jgi:hypothetical protein
MFIVKSSLGKTKHPKSETMLEAVYHHIKMLGVQTLDNAKVLNTRTKTTKELRGISLDNENIGRIQCKQTCDITDHEF